MQKVAYMYKDTKHLRNAPVTNETRLQKQNFTFRLGNNAIGSHTFSTASVVKMFIYWPDCPLLGNAT